MVHLIINFLYCFNIQFLQRSDIHTTFLKDCLDNVIKTKMFQFEIN